MIPVRKTSLLQSELKVKVGAVVQHNAIIVLIARREGLGADVKDPLLVRSVPMESRVSSGRGNTFIDRRHGPRDDLGPIPRSSASAATMPDSRPSLGRPRGEVTLQ